MIGGTHRRHPHLRGECAIADGDKSGPGSVWPSDDTIYFS